MAKNQQEIKKITIENVGTLPSGAIDPTTLVTLDSDIKALVNAVKSVVNSDAFKGVVNKQVDPVSGKASVDLYVTKSEYVNALNAINYQKGNLKSNAKYSASDTEGQMLHGTIQIHGESAKAKALEEIKKAGGHIVHRITKDRPDNYDWYAPADKSVTDKKAFRDSIFKETEALSKSYQKTKAGIQKEKEEEKQKKEEAKEQKESQRVIKGTIAKVLAILTVITDITRRILSSVMAGASQAVADTRLAGDYGLSYKEVRDYRVQEKALGIKDGSIVGAIQTLQDKFGNITSLDEKSIEQLAIVMGGEVKELIQSGIGGSNPDVLLSKILDKYFATAMSGYNSIGQYVGQEQARRELVSQLSKVSPQLSELLSVMLEKAQNPNSLYYGKFDTFNGMLGSVQTDRADLQPHQEGTFYIFGEYVNQLKSAVEDMKNAVNTIIGEKLIRVLEKVSQNTLFMSDAEKLEEFSRRKEANEKSKAYVEDKLNEIDSSEDVTEALNGLGVNTTITDVARSALGKKGGTLKRKEAQKILSSLAGNKNTGGELLAVLGYLDALDLLNEQINTPLEKGQTEISIKDPLIVSKGVESFEKILFQDANWDKLSKEEQSLLLESLDFIKSNKEYGSQVIEDIERNTVVRRGLLESKSGLSKLKKDLDKIKEGKGNINLLLNNYIDKAGYEKGTVWFGTSKKDKAEAKKKVEDYLENEIARLEEENLARALFETVNAPSVVSGNYIGSTHSDSAELMFNAFIKNLLNNYASEAGGILANGVNTNSKLTVEVKAEEGTSAKTTGSGDVTKVADDTWQMDNVQAR